MNQSQGDGRLWDWDGAAAAANVKAHARAYHLICGQQAISRDHARGVPVAGGRGWDDNGPKRQQCVVWMADDDDGYTFQGRAINDAGTHLGDEQLT